MTGPGAYPREPLIQGQASSNSDPWANDLEHSEAFMTAIKNGTPVGELRKMSADDAVMRAKRSQANPVMWHTTDGKPLYDNSVVQPPEQRSTEFRQWADFPDHSPIPPSPADGPDPDFLAVRQHAAAQLPARQPEGEIRRGLVRK